MNCTETKKIIMVGSRERITKANTSLALRPEPITFLFLSNTNLTRFLMVRKRRTRTRMTLILIRAKMRMLSAIGNSIPRSRIFVPR